MLLLCLWVHLHDSKDVSFCVFAVSHVANTRHCHFGSQDFSSSSLDLLHRIFEGRHAYSVDCCRVGVAFYRDGTIDPRFFVFPAVASQ